jgi:hypothetical protein
MNLKQIACVVFAAMLCLSQVACSASTFVSDLDDASVALAAVASVPNLPATVVTALDTTSTALDCVAAAVQAGGTNAQVAVASGNCGLAAFRPFAPAGTPQTVLNLIQALDNAIAKIISDQAQISVAMNAVPVQPPGTNSQIAFVNAFTKAPQGSKAFDAGHGGKTKIAKVRKAIAATKAKLPKAAPVTTVKQCPPNCN